MFFSFKGHEKVESLSPQSAQVMVEESARGSPDEHFQAELSQQEPPVAGGEHVEPMEGKHGKTCYTLLRSIMRFDNNVML